MARHRKDFTGERFAARITAPLTPADRAALEQAAAQMGLTPGAFARVWIMKGIAATATIRGQMVAQQALDRELAHDLTTHGQTLNGLARQANETQEIQDEPEIETVLRQLVGILDRIEAPPPGGGRASAERMALMNEATRIGNNVMQMRKIATARQRAGCLTVMDWFEDRIVACFGRMVSG